MTLAVVRSIGAPRRLEIAQEYAAPLAGSATCSA